MYSTGKPESIYYAAILYSHIPTMLNHILSLGVILHVAICKTILKILIKRTLPPLPSP